MMMETPTREDICQIIKAELPDLVKTDPEIRDFVLSITRTCYPDKQETKSRFDRIMEELKQGRLAGDSYRAEQNRKWESNQRILETSMAAIKNLCQKHDVAIGALGAVWGIESEDVYRNGIKRILEDALNVTVKRYQDYDHEGIVFGYPDQVELDVIIHNTTSIILFEIKSYMSKPDLYAFWRKKNFYEEKHGRKASRTLVISPIIDDRTRKVAKTLNIEMFGYAGDVRLMMDNG
jgi:hypothetical protein